MVPIKSSKKIGLLEQILVSKLMNLDPRVWKLIDGYPKVKLFYNRTKAYCLRFIQQEEFSTHPALPFFFCFLGQNC